MNRRRFLHTGAAVVASACLSPRPRASIPERARPSQPQLDWQRDELALFLHFGVNTFTDR
jgi:alpha-L-fucosidase